MKYIYYKSAIGNFGDDLNGWLWPQIFGDVDKQEGYFIGIGSILSENIQNLYNIGEGRKIVFGTGVRPSLSPIRKFKLDDAWNVEFLRGPLSSQVFDNKYDYITDSAYALRYLEISKDLQNLPKKYEVSLMPYFRSMKYLNWKEICASLGINYISPCSEHGVEFTLREIASSKVLITEAMHGAILADVLRVPWHRFILSTYYNETPYIAEFKWSDWLLSVGIDHVDSTYIPLYFKNRLTKWAKILTNGRFSLQTFKKKRTMDHLQKMLEHSSELKYYLSDDLIIENIDFKIANKIEHIKTNFLF